MDEYVLSTNEEKLEILNTVWNTRELTKEQKAIVLDEAAKLYNKLKCKECVKTD